MQLRTIGFAGALLGRLRSPAAGETLQASAEPHGTGSVGFAPLPHPPYQQPELLHRLGDLLAGARVPTALVVAMGSRERLQSCRGASNLGLTCHQGRAAEHPGGPQKLLGGRRIGLRHEARKPVQTLTGFQGKEVCSTERVGHGIGSSEDRG
jgi:hypothetical protein